MSSSEPRREHTAARLPQPHHPGKEPPRMLTVIAYLIAALTTARARWRTARATPERGELPDQIVWIALLVVLAITVIGIVTAKVVAKANGIGM